MSISYEVKADWFPSIILGIFACVTAITSFYLAIFFKENLGFSANQIGMLFSIQAITGVLAAFPAGIGNDRITSRTLVIICLILLSASLILMGVIKSFVLYTVVFFTWSLSNWVFRQSIDVQFLKSIHPPSSFKEKLHASVSSFKEGQGRVEIGTRIGFYQGCRFVGSTIGIISSGYFIAAYDFRVSLMAVGAICLLLIIPSVFLSPTPVSKVSLSDYAADFSNRKVMLFAGWMLLFATHWGAEQTCYGLFLRDNLQLSMSNMGWYMGSEFMTIMITVLITGNMIGSRESVLRIAIWGLFTSGIGHIGMIFEPVWVSVSFRILHGLGDGCMLLIFYYGIAKLFSIEHLGGNSGLINLSTMIGYIIGSLIYSPIGEHFGYEHPLWISGVLTVILIFPLLFRKGAVERF